MQTLKVNPSGRFQTPMVCLRFGSFLQVGHKVRNLALFVYLVQLLCQWGAESLYFLCFPFILRLWVNSWESPLLLSRITSKYRCFSIVFYEVEGIVWFVIHLFIIVCRFWRFLETFYMEFLVLLQFYKLTQ